MKGQITLYNRQGVELETKDYSNQEERRAIVSSWPVTEGYYYHISPKTENYIRLERQTLRGRLLIEQLRKAS